MNESFSDEELLILSGIQHIAFCERQWALIHIEQQWAENMRTVEGHHLHKRVDDPFAREMRKDILTLRSVSLVSYQLGLYGIADLVEFIRTSEDKGINLEHYPGKWSPIPIEYKRGKPKYDVCDEIQLCAQAICLEEMYNEHPTINFSIEKGYLYYGETRHRHEVVFNQDLRIKVEYFARRMHSLFKIGKTPLAIHQSHCKSCSLLEICNPKTFDSPLNVNDYLKNILNPD